LLIELASVLSIQFIFASALSLLLPVFDFLLELEQCFFFIAMSDVDQSVSN